MRVRKAELKQVKEITPPGFGRKVEIEITMSTTELSEKEIEKLFDTKPSERFELIINDEDS